MHHRAVHGADGRSNPPPRQPGDPGADQPGIDSLRRRPAHAHQRGGWPAGTGPPWDSPWTAEPSIGNPRVYAGTALRALASQPRHHDGVTGFAASLSAEVARSPDHDLFDLLPTHRASIGYRWGRTSYAIHPDASFTLEYKGRWLPFLLEFERRATTPQRIPRRLASYQRYFASGWAQRDHGGRLPGVLFVFETPDTEAAFLDIADGTEGLDVITANAEALAERGILGEAWILPPPHSLDRMPLAELYRVA